MNNIEMLKDTLQILDRGSYVKNGRTVRLKLSPAQMREATVLLPDDVEKQAAYPDLVPRYAMTGRCSHGCENADSFALARKRLQECSYLFDRDAKEILVLNLANPVNPGGGVRGGARAQEEDLCRKSSLLLSLESENAAAYYAYNKSLYSYMGSDALIFTPKVEIIRDENGDLLDDTVICAVLTCAAPMVIRGKEGMSEEAYEEMVYHRIMGMLKCAAGFGYRCLVLGAWGCGAFGNDARVISDLFYRALKEIDCNGFREKDLFRRIDFAVLDRSQDQYNYKEFCRNFDGENFYREENRQINDMVQERIRETEVNLDRIRGCLIGGAAGDALGYPVEFMSEGAIFSRFGEDGITEYQLDKNSGKALISDDTQMTLFTGNGLLFGDTRGHMRGIAGPPCGYVAMAYRDWYLTQSMSYKESRKRLQEDTEFRISWLLDVPELYSLRAPGNTCLSALSKQSKNHLHTNGVNHPINHSKGCGGVMRVAPVGLYDLYSDIGDLDREGAQIAAITHGHSLGYMPAAVLTHIINRIVFSERKMTLCEIVEEARDKIGEIFSGDDHIGELTELIDLAIRLSENNAPDIDNIHRLGEGWVADEALAISLYCALRYRDDFSAGIIAAVNHKGDSDSTGAITGNILGAIHGYDAIAEKWKTDLELRDVILELADDLCHKCQMSEYSPYQDPAWINKYIYARWKDGSANENG